MVVAWPKESRTKKAAGMAVDSFEPRLPGGGEERSTSDLRRRRLVSVLPDPVSPLYEATKKTNKNRQLRSLLARCRTSSREYHGLILTRPPHVIIRSPTHRPNVRPQPSAHPLGSTIGEFGGPIDEDSIRVGLNEVVRVDRNEKARGDGRVGETFQKASAKDGEEIIRGEDGGRGEVNHVRESERVNDFVMRRHC
jgi:hypothetical protein